MASVVLHAFNTIKNSGKMKLFRSHHRDYKDGEQSRDFIYVDDIAEVIMFFMNNQKYPGIYNVGTGKARSFLDLTTAVFNGLEMQPNISFIDTPIDLRGRYQYFTEAEIEKLREPKELEDALDKFEQDIKDLEARQVELTREQEEVKVKLEQKKQEKKLAIKKLKKMKD
jgi:nucleoside-diphosphate-sugar epimerase